MIPQPNRNRSEWVFVALLFVLCASLTALQYRWTGEIARAELTRLRSNLGEQCQQMCRAFDALLAESCAQLRPTRTEIEELGRDAAHARRQRDWLATNPRPIFRRIAVGTASREGVRLFTLDKESQRLAPLEWPPEWTALKEHFARDRGYGSGRFPFSNPSGALIEYSGARTRGGPPENERMFFELDLDYLRNAWLPELVRAYLNTNGGALGGVEIKTVMPPTETIYVSGAVADSGGEKPVSTRLNRQGRSPDSNSPGAEGRWVLEARHRPGALEAIVAASRQRNLGVAVALNLLILAAGIALVRHVQRSRRLAEAQMNFVANVSHEFRTPLTVIRGAIQNLRSGVVQEPAQLGQYFGLIEQHSDRLGELVEQVLEFAGAKKNFRNEARQPVAVAQILQEAIEATGPEAKAARCEVEFQAPPNLPDVSGNAPALCRVFQNLIANAAKHGGNGGWIGITAASTNGSGPTMVEVQVADRGPGIPEGEQAEIFKPFFRGTRAQEKQIRGSGLGLSLAREIVEAHGGKLSVRNAGERGAIFTVRLPANA